MYMPYTRGVPTIKLGIRAGASASPPAVSPESSMHVFVLRMNMCIPEPVPLEAGTIVFPAKTRMGLDSIKLISVPLTV